MAMFFATFILVMSIKLSLQVDPDNDSVKSVVVRECRESTELISHNNTDYGKLVEVPINYTLKLLCNFCKTKDDDQPKNWFIYNDFNTSSIREVEIGTHNNHYLNRIKLEQLHTLIITEFSVNDSGHYLCRELDDDKFTTKFNFLIDAVFDSDIEPETGSYSRWQKYAKDVFDPFNTLFKQSASVEYAYLRERLNLDVKMQTHWGEFGLCEVCGRPQGSGIRRKTGYCRLKFKLKFFKLSTNHSSSFWEDLNTVEKKFVQYMEISCRSLMLAELVEGIFNGTKVVPYFILTEPCKGVCNPDADGIYRGWKSTKKTGFKYRKSFVLAENSHITIICPDSSLENKVSWKHNGKEIKQSMSWARASVDSFNTLYLYDVTREEEGNYTCYVDEMRMQQVTVFVVSKSRLLTQAFLRHMMYLGFILLLTLSCYCAGIVITWTRRHQFKSHEEVLLLRSSNRDKEYEEDYV